MPFEVFPEDRGVYVKYYGHLTRGEAYRSLATVHEHKSFDRFMYRINDSLDVRGHDLSEADFMDEAAIVYGAEMSRRNRDQARFVAYVVKDSHNPIVQKILSAMLVPFQTATFSSVEAARSWIERKMRDAAQDVP